MSDADFQSFIATPKGAARLNQWKDYVSKYGQPRSTQSAAAPAQSAPAGMVEQGNITNLYDRPVLKNPDGSVSTTSSMSFSEDGREILIPTVVNGKRLTAKQAIEHYHKTGEHLGKFATPEEADRYAENLHNEQARRMGLGGKPTTKPAASGNGKASLLKDFGL
jgi:hypothetical protein